MSNLNTPVVKILLVLSIFVSLSTLHAQKPNTAQSEKARAFRAQQIRDAMEEKMHDFGNQAGEPAEAPWVGKSEMSAASVQSETTISTLYPESEVHAALNPTDSNNIVVGPIRLTTTMVLPVYYSKDFGKNWKKSTFTPKPIQAGVSILGGGDPVFAFDADGKLYMSWIDVYAAATTAYVAMYWASSMDGGVTWTRPANGFVGQADLSNSSDGFDDKQWMAIDRSNSQYHNTLYVAWTHLSQLANGIMVRRKMPTDDSLETPVQVSSSDFMGVQYTSIGVDSKGGVHVTYMATVDGSSYSLYHSLSTDGGQTFGPETKISDIDVPGRSPDATGDVIFGIRDAGNYPCPHLSIDTANSGNLYEVWTALGTDVDLNHGTDIYFSRSSDNGDTWSAPTLVNNDNVQEPNHIDHFYPSIAVNRSGTISVGWYDRREDPNDQIGRYYVGISTDQGHTWSNTPVASKPMDFNFVGNSNGGFGIGEYTQVLATPNYTIPVWTDGRDNAGRLRTFTAFIDPANSRVERLSTVDEGITLGDNYPNPFSGKTEITYSIASHSNTALYITDVMGKRIATLASGQQDAGDHHVSFDGSGLPAGVYYVNLETGNGVARRAIDLVR